ncbi:unnamed protein product [Paramecium octaurelia]|uniref:Uncharacterized protein n=1 Tax=Paramecium octaurelia TaxID=43137 RepID=A0A8S1WV22_PAROT|nr:unnamed protein product [Paramecium octaurelia]
MFGEQFYLVFGILLNFGEKRENHSKATLYLLVQNLLTYQFELLPTMLGTWDLIIVQPELPRFDEQKCKKGVPFENLNYQKQYFELFYNYLLHHQILLINKLTMRTHQEYQLISTVQMQVQRIRKKYPIQINLESFIQEVQQIFQLENQEIMQKQILNILQKNKILRSSVQINQFRIQEKQIILKANSIYVKINKNGRLMYQNNELNIVFQILNNLCIYHGQVVNKKPNGEGCFKWINGEQYIGQWQNAQKHGIGQWIGLEGDTYIGQWVNGQQDGLGEHKWNGNVYFGQWTNSVKNGYGIEQFLNGDKYIGNYFYGKPQGNGEYRWLDGSIYQGQFLEGKRHGHGMWSNKLGSSYEGDYENDLKHGKGKLIYQDGSYYFGQFVNDMREGQGTYHQSNGVIIDGLWKENRFIGSSNHDSHRQRKEQQQTEQNQRNLIFALNNWQNQKFNLQLKQESKLNQSNRANSTNQQRSSRISRCQRNPNSKSDELQGISIDEAERTIKKKKNYRSQQSNYLLINNNKKSIKNVFEI